jgi:DNA-directed RNA polymerase subunit E'
MYEVCTIEDTVRVPAAELGGNLKKAVLSLVQEQYEGLLDEDMGIVVSVMEIDEIGEGKVIPGDGAAYYNSKMKLLFYRPEIHEVIDGFVSEITEFGAFVRTGPIDALIHVSQIMDDYINYDAKLPGFIGKESGKKLKQGDEVRARVVTVSLKNNIASSKIGLTMRQIGLGKDEWKGIDEKIKDKKEKRKANEEKSKKETKK